MNDMSAEDYPPGVGLEVSPVAQHDPPGLVRNVESRPHVLIHEMTDMFPGESVLHHGVTGTVDETAALEQPLPLESHAAISQEPSAPPIPDTFPALESNDAIVARLSSSDERHAPNRARFVCYKLSNPWLALLIAGASALITVPGVVLGVLMRQVLMGIALSGAITTVVAEAIISLKAVQRR
ncbi:hypothetical protein INS49_012307 [Diaporthe citri]|uniref:uncharacterized protein n=1 Tax=Diaporthe citri TaxID=83186 RepID=UPI001C80CB11|nr:uncharacterized protein INS49_012307 [Diaporthe citri]KAG6358788.1 hypothetical protein INS49_012307 [Diaporthe citri]